MNPHATFLLALSPNPRGDVHRLVYADWLEEQGHPLAELLRLQIQIADRAVDDPETTTWHTREMALLAEHDECFEALAATLGDQDAVKKLDEDVLGLSARDPTGTVCAACGEEICPEFRPGSLGILHWQLNPGLAFNELVLGQRLPRSLLLCNGCAWNGVHCAACRRFVSLERFLWPFGNWRGCRCPDCQAPIPLLSNVLTAGVVGLGNLAVRGLSRLLRRRR